MRRGAGPAIALLLIVAAGLGAVALCAPHLLPGWIAEPLGLRGDIAQIRERVRPQLEAALAEKNLAYGAPVFVRIFKEEADLELWVKQGDTFALFKTYPICNYSGDLGPKLREGDRQSPEGVYRVGQDALNPNSRYHLSFNLGFPNAYDRAQDRTGSFLMVHGDCLSIGCYAMTDPAIEEIYVLAEAALDAGQDSFVVHAFPFRMSNARLSAAAQNPWHAFWTDLKPIYDSFEDQRVVPLVSVEDGRYVLAL